MDDAGREIERLCDLLESAFCKDTHSPESSEARAALEGLKKNNPDWLTSQLMAIVSTKGAHQANNAILLLNELSRDYPERREVIASRLDAARKSRKVKTVPEILEMISSGSEKEAEVAEASLRRHAARKPDGGRDYLEKIGQAKLRRVVLLLERVVTGSQDEAGNAFEEVKKIAFSWPERREGILNRLKEAERISGQGEGEKAKYAQLLANKRSQNGGPAASSKPTRVAVITPIKALVPKDGAGNGQNGSANGVKNGSPNGKSS